MSYLSAFQRTAGAATDWNIPEQYNIAEDVCDKWARIKPDAIALIYEAPDGRVQHFSFGQLRALSNQTANLFVASGVAKGDRVAILLPQCPQTAIAHLAAYKIGAVAVPLFSLFGEEALVHRLQDSGACILLTNKEGASKIERLRTRLPKLLYVLVTAQELDPVPARDSFDTALLAHSTHFEANLTSADSAALIIYTSGTTGKAKGALHAHHTLLGHLPGVKTSHGGVIHEQDIFWTPADWAWIGGLLDVLLPAWHFGATVVAHRFGKFDAAAAFNLIARHGVTNAFLPPTALKLMRSATASQPGFRCPMRSVASGGESLGSELLGWGRDVFGTTINEFYGQTECNMVVSSCAKAFEPRVGFIGRPVPGHDVRIVSDEGLPQQVGLPGNIGIRSPDPVMFMGYWNNPVGTSEKFAGEFLLTGDVGVADADGYIAFVGRSDDVITSAGYRIGPGPIEDCLLSHPVVKLVAVVGVPDAERTEIVKAFVVLHDGVQGSDSLSRELQVYVRTKVAAHEYPRVIEYLDELPTTSTGKIIRHELRTRG